MCYTLIATEEEDFAKVKIFAHLHLCVCNFERFLCIYNMYNQMHLLYQSCINISKIKKRLYITFKKQSWLFIHCYESLKIVPILYDLSKNKQKNFILILELIKTASFFLNFWNFEILQERKHFFSYLVFKNCHEKFKTNLSFDLLVILITQNTKNIPFFSLKYIHHSTIFIQDVVTRNSLVYISSNINVLLFRIKIVITKAIIFFNYGKYLIRIFRKLFHKKTTSPLITAGPSLQFAEFFGGINFELFLSSTTNLIGNFEKIIWILTQKKKFFKKPTIIRLK